MSEPKTCGSDPVNRDHDNHEKFMRKALELVYTIRGCLGVCYLSTGQAEKALASNEVPVGCVFVHENSIIGEGMNDTNRSLNVGQMARPKHSVTSPK